MSVKSLRAAVYSVVAVMMLCNTGCFSPALQPKVPSLGFLTIPIPDHALSAGQAGGQVLGAGAVLTRADSGPDHGWRGPAKALDAPFG